MLSSLLFLYYVDDLCYVGVIVKYFGNCRIEFELMGFLFFFTIIFRVNIIVIILEIDNFFFVISIEFNC